jgi:hypothetical protein
MEFVVVTFPNRRPVFMDDQPSGNTGDKLTVQAGHHAFDLGAPQDYSPKRQTVNVTGTTAGNPLLVTFIQAPVAAGAIDEGEGVPVPAPPSAAIAPSVAVLDVAALSPRAGARKKRARKAAPKRAAAEGKRSKAGTRRASTKKPTSRSVKKTASRKEKVVTRTSKKRASKKTLRKK